MKTFLRGAPRAHIDLATIVVEDCRAWDPDTGKLESMGGGYYCPGEPGIIHLDTIECTPFVARHELGHLVWHEVLTDAQRTSNEEAFAEAYAIITEPK